MMNPRTHRTAREQFLGFSTIRNFGICLRSFIILAMIASVLSVGGCAFTSAGSGVPTQLAIATLSLPQGQLASGYQASLTASGGKHPYTWSVTSGTLPSGLSLTSSTGAISGTPKQAGTSTFTIAVRDASSPVQSADAPMKITISNVGSALQISNAPLPSGVVQVSYTAGLSASGGTAPYAWALSAGQLPAGLAFSSTGAITGIPTTSGKFSFTVQATDSSLPASQTSTQSLSISISAATGSTGPYASRTDLNFIPLPVPLPSVGGAAGAGNCISQPGYNNLVCRATDINTLGATSDANDQEFSTCCGGFADINDWNTDSTMFFVTTNGGRLVAMSFSPTTHSVTTLYGQALPSVKDGLWSYSNPNLAYALELGIADPVIVSLTFDSQTTPPQPVVIADLSKVANCVAALAGTTAWEEMAVSKDEQTFVVAAGTGAQGTAAYVIVYNRTNGCRWYNTETREVGGNWGPLGTATAPDTFDVHSVRISGNGQNVMVTPSGTGSRESWTVDSLNVTPVTSDENSGHFAAGYAGFVNNPSRTADGEWCKYGMEYTNFSDLLNSVYVVPTVAQCGDTQVFGDDHASWNNNDTSDLQPFFNSTVDIPHGTPPTTAWQNEVLGFSITSPGIVWRFMSTYDTGTSPFFTCQEGIGTVSQDGKWFAFTSDWGNTLGLDVSGNNRCDVFVGQLK